MRHTPTEGPTAPNDVEMFEAVDEHLTKAWAIAEVVRLVRNPNELLFYPAHNANCQGAGTAGPRLNFLQYAMWLQADELERAWRSLHAWWDARATPPGREPGTAGAAVPVTPPRRHGGAPISPQPLSVLRERFQPLSDDTPGAHWSAAERELRKFTPQEAIGIILDKAHGLAETLRTLSKRGFETFRLLEDDEIFDVLVQYLEKGRAIAVFAGAADLQELVLNEPDKETLAQLMAVIIEQLDAGERVLDDYLEAERARRKGTTSP